MQVLVGRTLGCVLACVLAACQSGPSSAPSTDPTPAAPTPAGAARTLHIATTGDDSAAGASDRPWRTLQFAADNARAGDTLLIHGGTYPADGLRFTRSGAAGASISFEASPGETVIVAGDATLAPGVAYINLTGLSFRRYDNWGLTLAGNNHHVTLRRLDFAGGDAGIRLTVGDSGQAPRDGPVADIVVEDTVIRDAIFSALDCTPGPCDRVVLRRLEISGSGLEAGFGGDGLAVERGRDVLVEGCSIHDNGGDGIDLNSRDTAGHPSGIVVRNNQVFRNHLQGIKLWGGGRMERNVVWGQGINPVMIGHFDGTAEVVRNTIAYNMYDPGFGERDYSFVIGYPDEDTGRAASLDLTLTGNIFAFNNAPENDGHTGLYLGPRVRLVQERDNVYWSREDGEIQAGFLGDRMVARAEIVDGTWARLTGQGEGDLGLDPLFVSSWPAVDLHLRPGSPAAGRGAY